MEKKIELNVNGLPKNAMGNVITCELIITELTPIRDGKEIATTLAYTMTHGKKRVEILDCNDGNYIVNGLPVKNHEMSVEDCEFVEWQTSLDVAMQTAVEYLNNKR
jgi:hypothetical protein